MKRITVNEKLKRKISIAISDLMSLSDVDELGEASGDGELFMLPPDKWTEFENNVCDYTSRKESELIEAIYQVLGIESDVSESEVRQRVKSTQSDAELKHLRLRVEKARYVLNSALLPHNENASKDMIKNAIRKLDGES